MSASSSPATVPLSADLLAAIADLELAARLIVEGMRTGNHRSPFHGFNAEFRQYRSYRPGDELRHVDWKLFARSNRLFTRQFQETTNHALLVILDTSASMVFPPEGVTKFDYARLVAAALAWLAVDTGNAVGLLSSSNGRLDPVPPRGGRPHLRALLGRLARLPTGGDWDPPRLIRHGAQLLRRRGVIVIASDFYDAEEETRQSLRQVVRQGHDVILLQTLTPDEEQLSWHEQVELEDLESGRRERIDPIALTEAYATRMAAFLADWQATATREGIDYALLSTATPPAVALRAFLRRRQTLGTGGGRR